MNQTKPVYLIVVGLVVLLTLAMGDIACGQHEKQRKILAEEAEQAKQAVKVKQDAVQSQEPESPKLKLLNNDPEYDRLRKMSPYGLIDSLPAYKDAVEKRNSLIRVKVGNISDPSLYSQLAEEAGKGIPEIKRDDYYAAAEAEVQKQKQAYAAIHKDDYFLIGTYESYYPKGPKVVFNLRKAGISEDAKDFSSANFGASLPEPPKHYPLEDGGKYGISSLGESWDSVDGDPMVVNPDRYKPDWLEECSVQSDCGGALVVSVVPEKMDTAYAAVARLMGVQIEKLYADEMAAGGYHIHVTPEDEGTFISYSGFPPKGLQSLKEEIRMYVRRQSIWLLGKGDPMNPDHVKVREAYLVVGNEQFAKLK